MRVELLWWEGCPSHTEALSALQEILRDEHIEADVELVEVENDEQARAQRFTGSPTIRIDGEDAISSEDGEPYSLTCRVYRTRDGRVSATPDPDDLRDAIRKTLR